MNSEEIYEALTNEDLVKVGKWSEEVLGWFVKCAKDGMAVEFMGSGRYWCKAPPIFYENVDLYCRSSSNIFRVLF